MSTDLATGYEALRDGAGLVARPAGSVLVTGPDATSFLQSLLSNDLDPVVDGSGVHTLLLSPQGKLVVDLRALCVGAEEWWLDADDGFGPVLADGLRRFKIRVKVEITDRSDELARLTLRGARAASALEAAGMAVPPTGEHAHTLSGEVRIVRADWPVSPGFDLLGPVSVVASAEERLVAAGAIACGADALDAVRIESGVPRMGVDIDDATIPQEALLERDAVSFTKGCFLGQELVCRIDTRGHVNRYLRAVAFGDAAAGAGSVVVAGGKDVGVITSAARSPRLGGIGLATVRHEVEPPAAVLLRTDSGGAELPARVLELPLS